MMGNFLGINWPFGRVPPAASDRSSPAADSSRSPSRHRRVTSVENLERLAELQNYIVRGALSDFKKNLGSVSSSLDDLIPSYWVRPALTGSDWQGGYSQRRVPVSLCLLHVAASRSRPDMLELLLSAGASPNVLDSNGESALHHAATNPGSFRALRFYSCADQSRLVMRWTSGSHRCVEILCSASGIDVNISSRQDMATPLHRACEAGRYASVAVLLARGADPNALNAFGETAAAMALIAGHEDVFRLFLEQGILQGKLGAIPYILHTSVNAFAESPTQDKFNIIMEILRHDVDVNEQDQLGNTPLHYAAAGTMVDFQLISALLDKGSNADLKNKMGRTPLLEFFFSHQIHTNSANIKSVILLAAYMTTTPLIPPGQSFADNVHSTLWPRPYQEITDIIREVSGKLPSLGHLCRQVIRRAVQPHRLRDPDIISALPIPVTLRNQVASRVDPESFCGHLVDYVLEGRDSHYRDFLNYSFGIRQDD